MPNPSRRTIVKRNASRAAKAFSKKSPGLVKDLVRESFYCGYLAGMTAERRWQLRASKPGG